MINNNKNKTLWLEKEFTKKMINDTYYFQQKYRFELGSDGSAWNNESDAFRHAYMQAYLTLKYKDFIAKQLGDYHEIDGNINNNQDKKEEIMDLHNNKIGREIGNEIYKEYGNKAGNPDNPEIKDAIARKVVERMRDGKLILDPTGRRFPKEKLNIPDDNQTQKKSTSQKGCVGSYPVSGYIRADGKVVSDYIRTCGAKHAGLSEEEKLAGQKKYKNKKFQDIPDDEVDNAVSFFI